MSQVYVNGRWLPYRDSFIHVEDRGFQFADGVYESLGVRGGVVLDVSAHVARLAYSLGELKIEPPVALSVLPFLIDEACARNRVRRGLVYVQITRGVARRDHAFPLRAQSSLVLMARNLSASKQLDAVHVITHPDQRWKRCDIKSLNLLPNVLAREEAAGLGAQEAWLYDERDVVTEGAASNAWIIKGNRLMTHAATHEILNGITRQTLVAAAKQLQLELDESGFTRADALGADEAFISSSIGGVKRVLSIDGVAVPQGARVAQLQELFAEKK